MKRGLQRSKNEPRELQNEDPEVQKEPLERRVRGGAAFWGKLGPLTARCTVGRYSPFSTMSRNISKTWCFVKRRRRETGASKRTLAKPAFGDARGVWAYETWDFCIGARPARQGPESAQKRRSVSTYVFPYILGGRAPNLLKQRVWRCVRRRFRGGRFSRNARNNGVAAMRARGAAARAQVGVTMRSDRNNTANGAMA